MTIEDAVAATARAAVRDALVEAMPALVAQVAAAVRATQAERWVSRADAAEALSISVDTVDRRIRDGALTSRRIGKSVRVLLPGPAEMRP